MIILTSLSTVMATQQLFAFSTVLATLKLLLIVGSWLLIGYFCVPWLFQQVKFYLNAEILTIIAIALCLLLAATANYLHYSTALGAFVMGTILAETPMLAHQIKQLILPMRDIFAAMFFLSVGMMIDLKALATDLVAVLFFTLLIALIRILITFLSAWLTGSRLQDAIRSSLSVIPVGEFSFIIMGLGVDLGAVDQRLFQIIIGISAISTILPPYLIRYAAPAAQWVERHLSASVLRLCDLYAQKAHLLLSGRSSIATSVGGRAMVNKLLLNNIMISLIFITMSNFVTPVLAKWIPAQQAAVVSWGLALLGSVHFVREILLPPKHYATGQHEASKRLVSWGTLFCVLVVLSIGMLGGLASAAAAVAGVGVVVLLARRPLGKFYRGLSKYLTGLMARRQAAQAKSMDWRLDAEQNQVEEPHKNDDSTGSHKHPDKRNNTDNQD